jgi:hypothetical protein
LPSSSKRRNPYIVPAASAGPGGNGDGLKIIDLVEAFNEVGLDAPEEGDFVRPIVGPDAEASAAPMTMYVVGDFDADGGKAIAGESLKFLVGLSSRAFSFTELMTGFEGCRRGIHPYLFPSQPEGW